MLSSILNDLAAAQRATSAGDGAEQVAADACTHALALAAVASELGATGVFLADLLTGSMFDRSWDGPEVDGLVGRAAAALELDRDELATSTFLYAVHDPRLLSLSPRAAAEAQMQLLVLLAGVPSVSLWASSAPGEPVRMLFQAGGPAETRAAHRAADAAIRSGAPFGGERARVRALPVIRWEQPVAALVVRVSGTAERSLVLARECAATLAPVLEREFLLARSTERTRVVSSAGEARLRTVGLDLHDGALQEVARLRGDLQLFRHQLSEALAPGRVSELLLGRVDDVTARLVAIDDELRSLAASTHSPALLRKPFAEVLADEIALHGERSDLHARLETSGDLEELGQAQRIALFRIVQEALTNIGEHSDADDVRVAVRARAGQVRAEIVDDGRGFDVQPTLSAAAKRGRLGLLGMSERAALLGGMLQVDSRPGGPTRIGVVLPMWSPVDGSSGAADSEEPAAAPRQA